ncbi:hypothetical protein L916_12185 [Phytophthora nicotianae]|uniref:Dynein heavy chain hydrolytic ATP-binding dynein motor region domain-containing protein n=1 Tax=Phytophthora nicotianae TaxID=4792 RepID=W2IQB6_PHYNI|nr:hypothetical protein L916_12185 [Phytophthora nicotianae]
MIRPDLKPICENMLMSEGFQQARTLVIKFVTLYELSAGILKRTEPDVKEVKVLMRALRDFNTPRIPHHDTPIFLRIINDLFISFVVTSRITAPEPELSLRVVNTHLYQ